MLYFVVLSVYRVEVNSGVESVQLPCNSRDFLTENGKVKWVNNADNKVHIYQNSSDQPQEQHQFYRDQTKMKRNPLKSGDLSVNLTYPSKRDEGMYTCNVYSREGYIILRYCSLSFYLLFGCTEDSSGED